jgi:tetraacyldisaccharide 4'-kinase
MKRLDHYWYSRNPVAWALLPLSWLFCIVTWLRRLAYKSGLASSHAVPVPVIIVGNISVGGTGKTPLLIGLCDYLKTQGFRPGVISRGYGAAIIGEHTVAENDNTESCGDEPLLIRQRTGCPVVIGKNRVAAANKLLAENTCDIILSDDGLQHYRLKRDIEIAVVDTKRMFGNGFCLPAGPLREPVSRLDSVSMVVQHGDNRNQYHFSLQFDDVVNLLTGEKRKLEALSSSTVHAVAGIGHPARFFNQLRNQGVQVVEHAFPDHHKYTPGDIDFIDDLPILMTEKDAVKCRQLLSAAIPPASRADMWSVPVKAVMSTPLCADMMKLIKQQR